jgi:exodeoxyribonuclease V alpha subunit
MQVADDLLARSAGEAPPVDDRWLAEQLASLVGAEPGAEVDDARQRLACATAVLRRLSVIAGGPGTGKTTTVARVAALLVTQAHARGQRPPLIALAAPTGKAAVRLEQAVHDAARSLPLDDAARRALLELKGSTLHRLLGRRPGSVSRFRHDRHHRLPHDVVVVDETSMVSLSLMARLTEAVRPQARLVLVGDPDQLASIEAGAVLGDIVGPAADGLVMGSRPARPTAQSGAPTSIAGGIVILDRGFRFGTGIAALAEAVRRGDSDAVLARLRDGSDDVQWLSFEAAADAQADALEPIRAVAAQSASEVIAAARAGQADQALDALGRFRLLCGHRRGPHGVSGWTARVESWLAGALVACDTDDPWYPGRPLLVTENDYELGLYNGDTGVIVAREHGRVGAAFARRGEIVEHIPTRLGAVQTLYAMTIHKSQGSQFDVAAVLLPGPDSRILSRELLYTAITRARHRLLLAGSEAAIRVAVERPVARASGLGERLWKAPAVLRARA